MTATASVSPTGDLYIDGIINGTKWAVSSLTFSFPTSASFYGANYGSGEASTGFIRFTATQQAAVRSILTGYSSIINFTFTETTETATNHAVIRYAESSLPPTAWAYMPNTGDTGGDAWFNSTTHWYDTPTVGNYAWLSIMHETGHALGLKHPQSDAGTFGIMPVDHDSLEYTVMSYRSYVGGSTTSGYTNEAWGYPQTLMMYDVAALQEMYGANYTTNGGDTIYKWNPLTGQEFINGVGQAMPGANRIFMNVWDGGGHDTYDFSNYTTNLKVDLNPSGWTTTSTVQLANLGAGHYAIGNISNSLLYHGNTASLIEDAIGGSGNDTITGNAANNRLTGGHGNDILDGGAGTDTAVYSGAKANYQIVHNTDGSWTVTDLRTGSPDGADTLTNIEQAQFSDQLVALNATTSVASTLQVPTFTSFSNDTGVRGDHITNATILTFTGAGTAGSTIKLLNGSSLAGSAVADASGVWTVTTGALTEGPHTFTAVATNSAGSSGPSGPYTVTIDTIAPVAPTISSFSPDSGNVGDGSTKATTLTLTGTAEANSTVTLYDGTSMLGTAIAGVTGAWNFTTGTLAYAKHPFTATATDVAGNISLASNALTVTVDPNAPGTVNHAPVVIAADMTPPRNQMLPASTLFTASDADLDPVTRYEFLDYSNATNSGHFVVNGVAQTATPLIDISASQLSQTSFLVGAAPDTISVRAFDSAAWGAWTVFHITAPDHTPVIVAPDDTVIRGQNLAVASLFSATDADNDAITAYQFFDNSTASNSGHFVIGGITQSAGALINVSASQLAQTSFLTGAAPDAISVRAFDGAAWGAWTVFHVTAPDHAPVVSAADIAVTRGQALAVAPLFTAVDTDGDAITRYEFWDNGSAANSGHLVVNGAAQSALTIVDISASQLTQTTFIAGAAPDTISVRAFDGIAWGAWTIFHVNPPDHAPVVTTTNIAATAGQTVAIAPHISATDADNDPITAYEFWDATTSADSGHFVVNGVTQAAGTIIDVSAGQLAQTGFQAGSTNDALLVRAYDGITWGPWTALKEGVTAAAPAPIKGTAGNDTFSSTPANETFTGGAGSDTFVFTPHSGNDVITDFTAAGSSPDILAFSHAVFANAAAVLAHAVQVGPNVVITADAANSITLDNVTTTILQQHQSDFHFLA